MVSKPPSFIRFVILLVLSLNADGVRNSTFGQESDWNRMKQIQPKGYVCGISDTPLKIDGKLDEGPWQAARWTDDFVDIEGSSKPAPRFRTRAKMLWDNETFYIGAELSEPHLQGTLVEHDAVIFQDNDFEVFIDPNGDNHDYLEFELNTLNTTWDLLLPRPYKDSGAADNSFEFRGLKSSVHLQGTLNDPSDTDTGWSVEIAIPWSAFASESKSFQAPKNGDQWRIDFSRVEWQFDVVDGKYTKVPKSKEDNWVWSPPGIIDMHRPERWGFVQFSSELPGKSEFKAEASFASRDLLMEIYHRQRTYQQTHGRWAASFDELAFKPKPSSTAAELSMMPTEEGFQATAIVTHPDKSQELWNVRQDSKIWKTAESEFVSEALNRSGNNRAQLRLALDSCPIGQREGMEFLIANMPERDLLTLSSAFLLEDVRLAYQAWNKSPWKTKVPKEIFFNNVLPYASINERRDSWRKDFSERFSPLIEGAMTPSLAAARLNQKLFPLVNVRYSTQRPKADQSPYESIKSGTASCTGLSVLLIDACRSVGIPARFVGTPLWSDKSGNHSWIEVWDEGWHFTGAAEPNGDELDKAWFVDRASTAKRDDAMNAIYAVSFQRTPVHFPLVWDKAIDYINAVNVTERYSGRGAKPPEGTEQTRFRVLDSSTGRRVAANLQIIDEQGKLVFEGTSKDERFDANDHLSVYLPAGQKFTLEIRSGKNVKKASFVSEQRNAPITETIAPISIDDVTSNAPHPTSDAILALAQYLSKPVDQRPAVADQAFAKLSISKLEAAEATKLLWSDHVEQIRKSRAEEMESKILGLESLKMPFTYEIFGDKPATGRSMFISMHGGGGAPSKVNDQQWENQKKLYKLDEGVYVVPRAPTDTWDLWHQSHIDKFFDRLIENMIVFEDVDPNRVYIMGYSAGGDGVYQLAPRMADRWAAASMMAGHPNETSPLGLRNLPFTLHMGEKDAAYNRNKTASEWEQKLADLQRSDPEGYNHSVKIHAGKGHWMDREDAVAIPWMAKFNRNPLPTRIVWKQDDVVENRFYWLAAKPNESKDRAEIVATRTDHSIDVQSRDVEQIAIRLSDAMFDLGQPISITSGSVSLFSGVAERTISCIARTLSERGDPQGIFSVEVTVSLPKEKP